MALAGERGWRVLGGANGSVGRVFAAACCGCEARDAALAKIVAKGREERGESVMRRGPRSPDAPRVVDWNVVFGAGAITLSEPDIAVRVGGVVGQHNLRVYLESHEGDRFL